MAASQLARRLSRISVLGGPGRSLGWVIAAGLGLAAGGFVLHFPGSYGETLDWEVGPGVFGLAIGAANGIAFGVLLWLAAGGGRPSARRLVLFGALSVGLTHALHDASSFLTPHPTVALASGLCVAFAWWIAIRDRRPWRAGASGLAWAIGLLAARAAASALGLPSEETPVGWATDHAVQGLIVGLAWGGAAALLRPSTRTAAVPTVATA